MPIVMIKTMKGLLTKEKKEELHKKITDVIVEVEGNGNRSFAKLVVVEIQEEDPENFSMGCQQATSELVEKMSGRV